MPGAFDNSAPFRDMSCWEPGAARTCIFSKSQSQASPNTVALKRRDPEQLAQLDRCASAETRCPSPNLLSDALRGYLDSPYPALFPTDCLHDSFDRFCVLPLREDLPRCRCLILTHLAHPKNPSSLPPCEQYYPEPWRMWIWRKNGPHRESKLPFDAQFC